MCVSHLHTCRVVAPVAPPLRPPSVKASPASAAGVLLLLRLFDFLPHLSHVPESRERQFFGPSAAVFDPGGVVTAVLRFSPSRRRRLAASRLGGDDTRERSRVPRRFGSVFVREGTTPSTAASAPASNGAAALARAPAALPAARARPSPAIPRQPPAPTRAASPRRKKRFSSFFAVARGGELGGGGGAFGVGGARLASSASPGGRARPRPSLRGDGRLEELRGGCGVAATRIAAAAARRRPPRPPAPRPRPEAPPPPAGPPRRRDDGERIPSRARTPRRRTRRSRTRRPLAANPRRVPPPGSHLRHLVDGRGAP